VDVFVVHEMSTTALALVGVADLFSMSYLRVTLLLLILKTQRDKGGFIHQW